ncbi:hypothetical protein SAMN02745181_2311 [Rubritalea squalenifaciens DSM 18772]|uniref:Uncharacterized protein n=2 Tax=Rubritalea squalenifaciens TaxID=407226 RepID=A0A1M6L6X1_9BACT|nr:hypothetical protein SAMN02745181_2311 [Rubritalea squalenifaciens DSM 18772]
MTVIENKKIYKHRSIVMDTIWGLFILSVIISGVYRDNYRDVWLGVMLLLLFTVVRWMDIDKIATEGVSSIRVGEAALTVEYIGRPVFKVHKDLIHSIKGYKRQAHIYYYRNEELCVCSLPKKYFDPESWKQVQKLQEML